MEYSAEDVVLTNIRSSDDENGVEFDMYVENTESMVLNQQALLLVVMVSSKPWGLCDGRWI